jgi:hypothetical protein
MRGLRNQNQGGAPLNLQLLMTNMKTVDENQFRWLAQEFTADLDLGEDELQEFAELLKAIALELNLTPNQLINEVNKRISPETHERDEADWWKDCAA